MLAALFELHTAHWNARGQSGVLADPAVRRFHRAAAPRLLKSGLLRLFVLEIGGVPAGALYMLCGSDAYLYACGHSPRFRAYGIGNLLIEHALLEAHAAGKRRCDFLRGTERYKYAWGAHSEFTRRISIQGVSP
jgi:CelD/BcsL family acetyltransferase involved in cellulose biosynthesis